MWIKLYFLFSGTQNILNDFIFLYDSWDFIILVFVFSSSAIFLFCSLLRHQSIKYFLMNSLLLLYASFFVLISFSSFFFFFFAFKKVFFHFDWIFLYLKEEKWSFFLWSKFERCKMVINLNNEHIRKMWFFFSMFLAKADAGVCFLFFVNPKDKKWFYQFFFLGN